MHLEKKERVKSITPAVQEIKNTLWQQVQLHFKKYALRIKALTQKNFYLEDQYNAAYAVDNLQEIQRCQIDIKMSLLTQADRIAELPHKMMIYGKQVHNDFFLRSAHPRVVSSFHLLLEDQWQDYLRSLETIKYRLAQEDVKTYILSMLPSVFVFEGNVTTHSTEEGIIFLVERRNDYENIFDMISPLQNDPYLYFSQQSKHYPPYCAISTKHFGSAYHVACICTEATSLSRQEILKHRALQEVHNKILSPELKEDATYLVTQHLPYNDTAQSYLKDRILVGIAGNIRGEEDLYHFAVTSQHPYQQYISAVTHECLRREEEMRALQIEGKLTTGAKKEHMDIIRYWEGQVEKQKIEFEKDAQEYVRQACTIMSNLSFHPRVKKLLSITPLHLWKDLL